MLLQLCHVRQPGRTWQHLIYPLQAMGSPGKMLLFGSKLTGMNLALFSQIPSSFGLFIEAVRSLHACTRIELNSSVKLRKPTENDNCSKEASVVDLVWFLAKPIKTMAETSFKRAKLNIESIVDEKVR
jgi:hypothetical protein